MTATPDNARRITEEDPPKLPCELWDADAELWMPALDTSIHVHALQHGWRLTHWRPLSSSTGDNGGLGGQHIPNDPEPGAIASMGERPFVERELGKLAQARLKGAHGKVKPFYLISERKPEFPCWAYDYMWSRIESPGHLLDQHIYWSPDGLKPTESPYATPVAPSIAQAAESAVNGIRRYLALSQDATEVRQIITQAFAGFVPGSEVEVLHKRAQDWMEAGCKNARWASEARDQLTAAQAENAKLLEKIAQLEGMRKAHRWNIQPTENGFIVCKGDHEKNESCENTEYVKAAAVSNMQLCRFCEGDGFYPSEGKTCIYCGGKGRVTTQGKTAREAKASASKQLVGDEGWAERIMSEIRKQIESDSEISVGEAAQYHFNDEATAAILKHAQPAAPVEAEEVREAVDKALQEIEDKLADLRRHGAVDCSGIVIDALTPFLRPAASGEGSAAPTTNTEKISTKLVVGAPKYLDAKPPASGEAEDGKQGGAK